MTRFQRWLLYGSTIVATASGVTYFVMKRFMTPVDPWAVINHPLEPWALKLHILSAPIMLFASGLITTQHIWRSMRSNLPTGRNSGLVAVGTFAPLVVTGYLIQTFTSPTTLTALGWGHLVLGLACSAAVLTHRLVLKGRRRRRRPGTLPVLAMGTSPSEASIEASAAGTPSGGAPPVEASPLETTARS